MKKVVAVAEEEEGEGRKEEVKDIMVDNLKNENRK